MPQAAFHQQLATLTAALAQRPLDAALDNWLNAEHGAGSAHCPTVAQGRALVLYLLPEGRIDFSPRAA